MMANKIAFTGPFADINFGDYGMVINNLYDIKHNNAVLFSYDKTFLNDLNTEYLNGLDIDIIEVETSTVEKKEGYAYTPLEIMAFSKNKEIIRESMKDVDVLIVNGGGYFNGLWSLPHRFERLIKIIIPILVADELNKKIVFTGNSYGPFGEDKNFFGTLFSSLKNTVFGVRDQLYSTMWFNELGVDKELKFIPDDLLLINNEILNRKTLLEVKEDEYIILETYLTLEYIKHNIKHFESLAQRLKDKYNLKVLFLPLHLGRGGMDQGEYLAQEIENIELIDISEVGYLPIQDAVEIIKKAKLIISSRYHALVLAVANKVPIISVLKDVLGDKRYYYNKNAGLIRQVFNGIEVDESKIIKDDYIEGLNFIEDNIENIIEYQNSLYDNNKYTQNLEELRLKRNQFISENIM